MFPFASIALPQIYDCSVFLLHINIVELGTEVHFHGCNIFSPQLLLLFFLRRCQPLCFRLAGKFV